MACPGFCRGASLAIPYMAVRPSKCLNQLNESGVVSNNAFADIFRIGKFGEERPHHFLDLGID